MNITKKRLKQIINEEMSRFSEAEGMDLAKLQPMADSAAKQVVSAAEKASAGDEAVKNLLIQAIITQLQSEVG